MYVFVAVMERAPFLSPLSSDLIGFLVALWEGSILYFHLYYLLLFMQGLSC